MTAVLLGRRTTVAVSFYDGETPQTADGDVAVTVANDEGTEVATGNATKVGDTYTFTLSGDATSQLDRLTLTWQATIDGLDDVITSYVDVVGGFHTTIADIRSYGPGTDLESAKYDLASLEAARAVWEAISEESCNRAFVPRYQRITRREIRATHLVGPADLRAVRWATVDGETVPVDDWDIADGVIVADRALSGLIEVGVEYGMDACPADVADAGRRWIRQRLREMKSATDNPRRVTADGAIEERESYQSATQDKRADNVLMRYRAPAIA